MRYGSGDSWSVKLTDRARASCVRNPMCKGARQIRRQGRYLQRLVACGTVNGTQAVLSAQEVLRPERGLVSSIAYFTPVLRKVAI